VEVAIIADDLTGAADSGVQLARSGYRTVVVFCGASIPPGDDLDAVAVDTDSRSLPAGFAAKRVVETGHAVREARIVYKKIDSTLRGPIGAELAAALAATRRRKALIAPAFPSTGRETKGGTQLVHGVPVHETDLSKDPVTPVLESHIPSLIAHAFGNVVALSVTEVRNGERVHDALEGNKCVVADAESDGDLEALVRAVPDPSSILWVGSAGLARALGEVYPGAHNGVPTGALVPASAVLAVVGSVNEVAREQLLRLSQEPGLVTVYLDTAALFCGSSYEDTVGEAAEAVRNALSSSRGVALSSAAGEEVDSALRGASVSRREVSERVSDALAEIVARLSGKGLFDALILTGGDTAVRVAGALRATGILLEGEVEAGVPVGTLVGPHPYRVVTKAGGFGGPDTLLDVYRTLAEPRENGET
jgi:D-threonate/D-erythronate kinase